MTELNYDNSTVCISSTGNVIFTKPIEVNSPAIFSRDAAMADKADKRLPDESDMLLAKIEELKRQIKSRGLQEGIGGEIFQDISAREQAGGTKESRNIVRLLEGPE